MRKPRTIDKTIYDQALHKQGFLGFSASSVVSGGKAIAFSYPSGMRYIVPLEYILSWFGGSGRGEEPYSAARSRRLSGGHLVRLYLSDGKHVDVAWDTVLMACEPLYEHYCGLTEESKALTKRWKPNFGNLSSMKVRPGRSARRLLFDLSALFASPILDADECLVISRESDVFRHALSFPGDPVGFEAFVNHVHLDDTLASAAVKLSRICVALVSSSCRSGLTDLRHYFVGGRCCFILAAPEASLFASMLFARSPPIGSICTINGSFRKRKYGSFA
jgi:hypothetical protein